MAFDRFELQKAVFELLAAEFAAEIAAKTMAVYSYVPQNSPYPYIRIDSVTLEDAGTKDVGFADGEIIISAFYRDVSSSAPVCAALKRVRAALHERDDAITMPGQEAVLLRWKWEDVMQRGQPDDQYLHGMQRYHTFIREL